MSEDKFEEAFSEIPDLDPELAKIVMSKANVLLTKTQYVYFYYSYVKNMTANEIAEKTGKSTGTIHYSLARARKAMEGLY